MRKNVDTMIVVPNERLLAVVGKGIPFQDALKKADEVLLHATQGISSLISVTGLVNVDFADVRTVMQSGGSALMGTGVGRGENRAIEAAQQAISSRCSTTSASPARPACSSTSPAALTSRSAKSTRSTRSSTTPSATTPRSSSAPCTSRRCRARFASPSSRPASTSAMQPTLVDPGAAPAATPGPAPKARRLFRSRPIVRHACAGATPAGVGDVPRAPRQPPPDKGTAGSQRHGDPDVHSETDGLKSLIVRDRHLLPWWRFPSRAHSTPPRAFPTDDLPKLLGAQAGTPPVRGSCASTRSRAVNRCAAASARRRQRSPGHRGAEGPPSIDPGRIPAGMPIVFRSAPDSMPSEIDAAARRSTACCTSSATATDWTSAKRAAMDDRYRRRRRHDRVEALRCDGHERARRFCPRRRASSSRGRSPTSIEYEIDMSRDLQPATSSA